MLPLMILTLSLLAADPPAPPPIRLPAVTVTDPAPPSPMPGPAAPTRLTTDRLYVLDSDVPVIVLTSPTGLVTLTEDAGPLKVRGQFADGTGKYETRTFAGKYVYTLEASHTGRVELIVVPVGAKTAGEVIRRTIDVDAGDKPQPPQPGPGPAPQPTPGPVVPVKLKAVAVYESEAASLAAGTFFADKAVRGRWAERGHLPPVLVDKDVRDPETLATPAKLKPFIDRAAKKALPQLYLVNADSGDVLFEGPIPETPAALLALLTKIGG